MTPEERVLEAYYDRLTVFPVEKSHVIVIDFLSENPELAARVANAIADAYLQRQQEAKQDQARNAGHWLSGEIETLRKKVADAEAKVEAFRAKSNLLVGPNNTKLSVQQLGDLNTQLATARAQKSDAEAKARLIRDMLKSGEPINSSDILNSELIRRLSEQRVTLRAQLAEQSSSLLGNHPRIKELKAQIGDLDIQIRKEAEIIARSLENDAKLADARVAAQLATFDQLKSQAVTSNEDDVQLRALEREAKSQRDLLESYLAKYREASARDTIDIAPPDARVISRATVSNVPAYPKKLPTVLIATLATMVLMSGMVLTRELLDSPAPGAGVRPRRVRPRRGTPKPQPKPTPTRPDLAPIPDRAARFEPAEPRRGRAPTPAARSRRGSALVQEEPRAAHYAARRAPPPVGVPVSAIEDFAHNLHPVGVGGSQIAFFAAAPDLDLAASPSGSPARSPATRAWCWSGSAPAIPRSRIFPPIPLRRVSPSLPQAQRHSATSSPETGRRASISSPPAAAAPEARFSPRPAWPRTSRRWRRPMRMSSSTPARSAQRRLASARAHRPPCGPSGRDARRASTTKGRDACGRGLRQCHAADRRPHRRDAQSRPAHPRRRGVAFSFACPAARAGRRRAVEGTRSIADWMWNAMPCVIAARPSPPRRSPPRFAQGAG